MITYEKFRELFNMLENNRACEIEIYFTNKSNYYMLIKYQDYLTFGVCGESKNFSLYKFATLDELYNSEDIKEINLRENWQYLDDIIIDSSFSVIEDKEYLSKVYGVNL